MTPLDRLLGGWPAERQLVFCDEVLAGAPAVFTSKIKPAKSAILIGPEGGFSSGEREKLASLSFVTQLSLGPRILRADTAAVAAIALWQSILGDWA